MNREEKLQDNLRDVNAVIWGQSSSAIHTKLKDMKEYEQKSENCDCAWLLKSIKI